MIRSKDLFRIPVTMLMKKSSTVTTSTTSLCLSSSARNRSLLMKATNIRNVSIIKPNNNNDNLNKNACSLYNDTYHKQDNSDVKPKINSPSYRITTNMFPNILCSNNLIHYMQQRGYSSQSTNNNNIVPSSIRNIEEERIRRCLFSVPGSKKKMLQKVTTLDVDSIVYDLEDGVPHSEKEIARQMIHETLQDRHSLHKRAEICIRTNGLDTLYYEQDLHTLVPCPTLQTIVIPKVESLSDLMTIHDIIQHIIVSSSASSGKSDSQRREIRLLAAIESARGLLNLRDIAEFNQCIAKSSSSSSDACHIVLDGLIFASEDYCANVEAIRTEHGTELLYARSQLVTVAKAYQLQAIDMVHINFRDLTALQTECQHGKELGYNGKQAIHPNQIPIIQSTFIPSMKDVLFAKRCCEQFTGTPIEIDGIVVDTPVHKWAMKIIHRAKVAGIEI